jgi:diaminopimelate epimerase
MKREIPFFKFHGAGNDFILIDNRQEYFRGNENEIFQQLCSRRFGIGADGLMLLSFRECHTFRLQFFNADGKRGEMCGNGARCAVYLMHLLCPNHKFFRFEIHEKWFESEIKGDNQVKITWEFAPKIEKIDESILDIPIKLQRYLSVNSGVPHLMFVPEQSLDRLDVFKWGKYFRYHDYFAPNGTNVNFLKFRGKRIYIRTYERGVENETLACGTGAVAAAIAGKEWDLTQFPVEVVALGGILRIGFDETRERIWMEGPVKKVFTGVIELDN